MKVLITGGAGFIGGHVAQAYLARGDKVWVLDDFSTGKPENVPAGAEVVRLDIGDAEVGRLFDEVGGFDLVNHHAAQIDVRRSVADPREDARINVDGLLNIVENSVRHRARRFVFVSSGGVVYGEPDTLPTTETAPKRPLSPYGVTKLTAEYYLHYFEHVHGLEYVALRYSNVYGPRQDPHGEAGVVAIFSQRIRAGEPLTVFGDGGQTRDYVFVGDVVRANLMLGEAPLERSGSIDDRAFNVGTGASTSVLELADLLMGCAGERVDVKHAPDRPGELRHSRLGCARAAQHGWQPVTPLREGLAATYTSIVGVAS